MTLKTASAKRVAARYQIAEMEREAALKEWLKWMAVPFDTLLKHHREFILGPVEDAIDDIIHKLAPELIRVVGEREVDEDVDEFLQGAQRGKHEADGGSYADVPRNETEDFQEGYEWGFANHEDFNGRALPSSVKRQVVDAAVKDFRQRVTSEVVEEILSKAWHAVSPSHTIKAIIRAVKKHGWKLGVGFALFEVFEHAVLPAALIAMTGDPKWAVLGTLPVGEVIYAIIFRILGRAPKQLQDGDPDGHLDWYEAKFGPVRLASASRVMTAYQIRATCHDRLTTTRLSPA